MIGAGVHTIAQTVEFQKMSGQNTSNEYARRSRPSPKPSRSALKRSNVEPAAGEGCRKASEVHSKFRGGPSPKNAEQTP